MESETLSMNILYFAILKFISLFYTSMNLSPIMTLCIGLLENTDSLSHADFPKVDEFPYKQIIFLNITNISSEKSMSIEKLLES